MQLISKSKVLSYFMLLAYATTLSVVSFVADLDAWLVTLLLLVVPTLFMATKIKSNTLFYGTVIWFAFSATVLWEAVGYAQGLWYGISVFDWRVFGLFPVESFLWTFSLLLFTIVSHEFFTDDKTVRFHFDVLLHRWLIWFSLAICFLGVLMATVLLRVVVSNAYALLILLTVSSLAGAFLFARARGGAVLAKAGISTLLVLPVLLMQAVLSITNVHTVFANPNQYLASISFLGELIPVEFLFFLAFVPVWVISVYEWYLDDGR